MWSPIASPKNTVPTGMSLDSTGLAMPVTANPTSAFSAWRTPFAMTMTASRETIGPWGISHHLNDASFEYATTLPTNTSLATGIAARRAPTRPPVRDSATARRMPRSCNKSRTTDSMVSSSMPNTQSPRMRRTRSSSSATMTLAAASSGALTVIRTLSPSIPLA